MLCLTYFRSKPRAALHRFRLLQPRVLDLQGRREAQGDVEPSWVVRAIDQQVLGSPAQGTSYFAKAKLQQQSKNYQVFNVSYEYDCCAPVRFNCNINFARRSCLLGQVGGGSSGLVTPDVCMSIGSEFVELTHS